MPLYAFLRRTGHSDHDSQDLVQGFFEQLLSKDFLKSVEQEKGRFRSFMLVAIKFVEIPSEGPKRCAWQLARYRLWLWWNCPDTAIALPRMPIDRGTRAPVAGLRLAQTTSNRFENGSQLREFGPIPKDCQMAHPLSNACEE